MELAYYNKNITTNMEDNIKQKAFSKMYSKVYFSKIKIKEYEQSMITGAHGGVTEIETKICLDSEKINLKVLQYIQKLIINNKYE